MSFGFASRDSSSDDDDGLLLSSKERMKGSPEYEPVGTGSVQAVAEELEELDVDGNPIYDDDDHFDYPHTEKKFGEVVVVMKHIQKGTKSMVFRLMRTPIVFARFSRSSILSYCVAHPENFKFIVDTTLPCSIIQHTNWMLEKRQSKLCTTSTSIQAANITLSDGALYIQVAL